MWIISDIRVQHWDDQLEWRNSGIPAPNMASEFLSLYDIIISLTINAALVIGVVQTWQVNASFFQFSKNIFYNKLKSNVE